MPSPIAQLQQSAIDHNVPLPTVLRYALLIASRLEDKEMTAWCIAELGGYSDVPVPDYRVVFGICKCRDHYGRTLPIDFESASDQDKMSRCPLGMSTGEIEGMLRDRDDGSAFQFFHPPKIKVRILKGLPGIADVFIVFQHQALIGVLETIRNKIIEWTIGLENKGLTVGGPFLDIMPRKVEVQSEAKAQNVYNGPVTNIGEMNQSQLQAGTVSSTQSGNYTGMQMQDVSAMVNDLLAQVRPLEGVEDLRDELINLQHLLNAPKPKEGWVKESLRSLRTILENATGGAIGNAVQVAPYVQQIVAMLGQ
jgi:hypothetical protein